MNDQFNEIAEVLAGNKELKVGMNTQAVIALALAVFVAMFMATLAAKAIVK